MAKKDLDLADILAGELNKTAKDQKVAFFLDSDEAPTNVEGWIKEVKNPPKEIDNRRGKPPTWYKEQDVPQFERMISNPDGAVIRERESEYQKNLDNLTEEIPIIK